MDTMVSEDAIPLPRLKVDPCSDVSRANDVR